MSFLSVLGKIFKGINIGAGIATEVAPLVPGPAGGILAGIGGIGTIVGLVEGVLEKSVPGSVKLSLAAPIVEQAILAELAAKGIKIADDAKFKGAIGTITSGVVDLLNSLEAPKALAPATTTVTTSAPTPTSTAVLTPAVHS